MPTKSLTLLFLAAIFVFASCGGSEINSPTDSQTDDVASTTTTSNKEEAPEALEVFAMGLTNGPEASKKLLQEMAVIELRDHEIGTHTFESVELDGHPEAGCFSVYLIGAVEDREYKACFFDDKLTALELLGTYTEE